MLRKAARRLRHAPARVYSDFQRFLDLEVSGGVVLLIAAAVALVAANSPWAEEYARFWGIRIGITVGSWEFFEPLKAWIDDGLMALFFFVVGLELKREVLAGELSSVRKASLPIIAAIGGMALPALVYLAVNPGGAGASGWGIPMATDIAFALGALALLGSSVPLGLKVFLTAFAIADDIGAILVIALFYAGGIHLTWLSVGLALLLVLLGFNRLRVDSPVPYAVIGVVVWFAFLHSGIHATIAGVLVALTIPATARVAPLEFVSWTREELALIEACDVPDSHVLDDPEQQHIALEIQAKAGQMAAPLQRLEHLLQPFTTYIVLPLFALANAGVSFTGEGILRTLAHPVALGIFLGLLAGKSLGIFGASWVAIRMGVADLPPGVRWPHLFGAGILGAIGFTMSLFVANLAFAEDALLTQAKLAILMTSLVAGVLGYLFLRAVAGRSGAAAVEV